MNTQIRTAIGKGASEGIDVAVAWRLAADGFRCRTSNAVLMRLP